MSLGFTYTLKYLYIQTEREESRCLCSHGYCTIFEVTECLQIIRKLFLDRCLQVFGEPTYLKYLL